MSSFEFTIEYDFVGRCAWDRKESNRKQWTYFIVFSCHLFFAKSSVDGEAD